MRPGLLVSVRDAAEAQVALDAGADLIDVKEPHRGPLGAAEGTVIAAVASVVAGRKPLSVALGEASDVARTMPRLPPGITYAKVGLSGCRSQSDWPYQWRAILQDLPAGTAPVAVAYADWMETDAPSPPEVLKHGCASGCRALLLDTFQKLGGGLFDRWATDEVARLIRQVQRAGLLAVIGGSLNENTVVQAANLQPDYVAVRGAACRGGRADALDGDRVRRLAELIRVIALQSDAGHFTRGVADKTQTSANR